MEERLGESGERKGREQKKRAAAAAAAAGEFQTGKMSRLAPDKACGFLILMYFSL